VTPCTSTASGPGNLPNCETRYTEGLDIGYRWFERNALTPQYPFGHGLSYTQFRYSRLSLSQGRRGQLRVSFHVRNLGDRRGDEVPQVYLGPPSSRPAGVQFAVKALAAFDRITLRPHESRRITLDVQPRELSYWDTADSAWTLATGTRTVFVGGSERDVAIQATTSIRRPGG
jgi:beta-glucosidase